MRKKLPMLKPVPTGYKVKLHHYFKPDDLRDWTTSKKPPKYVTLAVMVNPHGEVASFGGAACSPKDNPSRKLGRVIAHNRCLDAFYHGTIGEDELEEVTQSLGIVWPGFHRNASPPPPVDFRDLPLYNDGSNR
jgi:hypothetical protein